MNADFADQKVKSAFSAFFSVHFKSFPEENLSTTLKNPIKGVYVSVHPHIWILPSRFDIKRQIRYQNSV